MAASVGVNRPRRRRRWSALAFILLLVVPTIEIAVIIGVGRVIGGWPTIALLIVESALGAWLVRREGTRTWLALSNALRTGAMPSRQLADAALVLIGGTLLLTPGFLTDLVGFFFILPLTRPLARAVLEAFVARRLMGGIVTVPGGPPRAPGTTPPQSGSGPGDIIEGEIL